MSEPFSMNVRIYFEDTDTGGVVYHANYVRFFERARTEYLRKIGLEQRGMIASGQFVFVVSGMTLRFKRPAVLDDLLIIKTRIKKLGRASVIFEQSAWRSGELLCEAEVRVGSVSMQGRPTPLPDHWYEAIHTEFEKQGN